MLDQEIYENLTGTIYNRVNGKGFMKERSLFYKAQGISYCYI
jgi:hypothetical protein